jgi:hypothetical protein
MRLPVGRGQRPVDRGFSYTSRMLARVLSLLLLVLAGARAAEAQTAPETSRMDDATYVAFLADADVDTVDARRLSRLFFGVAATLDGGRTSVRLLQNAIVLRDSTQEAVRATLRSMDASYEVAVGRMRTAVTALLDTPDSAARLNETLVDGQESCYRLDAYSRLAETYGARASDLVSILASTEACARFRQAAFTPGVRALVSRGFGAGGGSQAEVERLKRELAELQKLLDDLRAIDKKP